MWWGLRPEGSATITAYRVELACTPRTRSMASGLGTVNSRPRQKVMKGFTSCGETLRNRIRDNEKHTALLYFLSEKLSKQTN